MRIWMPAGPGMASLVDAAKRMGVEIKPLPSIEEWRAMYCSALEELSAPTRFPVPLKLKYRGTRWPDAVTELDRWADDGGRVP